MLCQEQKDGSLKNMLVDAKGEYSLQMKQMICGMLMYADALTAFGNTIPTAYLRLVPHQEAPTNIC
jgi:glutamine synthetase